MSKTRKELIQEYKQTPAVLGVCAVRHRESGKMLVLAGAVQALLNRQRAQLRLGAHPARALLADWQACGEDAFEFEILDTLKPSDEPGYDPADDLKTLHELWLDKLRPFEPKGYNRAPRS